MVLIRVPDAPGTFDKAPLALVACQVNFDPLLRLSEAEFVAPLQEVLRDNYPIVSRVGSVQLSLGSAGLRAEPADLGAWAFASADQNWQLTLGRDSLTIQAKAYESFESL